MILRLLSGMGFFVHVIILVLGLSLQFLRVGSGAGTRQWLGFTKAEMDRICPKHCVIWLRPTAVFLHWDFSFIIFANLRKTWHMTRGCDECSFFWGDVFNIQYVSLEIWLSTILIEPSSGGVATIGGVSGCFGEDGEDCRVAHSWRVNWLLTDTGELPRVEMSLDGNPSSWTCLLSYTDAIQGNYCSAI